MLYSENCNKYYKVKYFENYIFFIKTKLTRIYIAVISKN